MSAVGSGAPAAIQPLQLPSHRDPYYGGAWQEPKSPRYVDTISPGTGESLGKVIDGSVADAEAAIAAAKSAFKEWRRVPPLERAKLLRKIADVLRQNGEELAMIDAADCGNPYAEMVRDAQAGAAQLDFYAGLVTEMKGASIPMGPDAVNFSVREPFGVVGRIIPFNHPFMFVAGKSAAPLAAGNTDRGEAARAGAAIVAAARRTDRRHPAAGRMEPRSRRQGGRAGAGEPSGRGEGGADRQRADRTRGHEGCRRHAQARHPRARRQERADRVSGRRSRGGLGRHRRRHELHLVRAVLRFDQPRLRARAHLRPGTGARAALHQALQARHPDRSQDHDGGDRQQAAVRAGAGLHRGRHRGRRPAHHGRQAAGRSLSRQRLLRRAHHIRRRQHGHADRQGGNLRTHSVDLQMDGTKPPCWSRSTRSSTA